LPVEGFRLKRTLLICEKYPLPENFGGGMRTMNFVRSLAGISAVEIAYCERETAAQMPDDPFADGHLLNLAPIPKKYHQHLSKFGKGIPHPIREYTADSCSRIAALIEARRYDYILLRRYVSLGNLRLNRAARKRVIVDFDDIVSGPLYRSYFYPTNQIAKRALRHLNWKLLKWYERRCLQFGAAVFCSAKDAVALAGADKPNVFVVPNIYDSSAFGNYDFGDGSGNAQRLLFMGSLDYGPNVDGLVWFVQSVYRRFRAVNPQASLVVVGKNPAQSVKDLCAEAGIQLQPNVPDVKEYYEQCGAVVVPILSGGGTRIKILEAAAAGRPVLSTPLGAEGLDLSDGAEILLFKDSEDFIARHRMLGRRDTYHSIVSAAKSAVTSKFSRQVFETGMRKVMEWIDHRAASA
jgi:glycosyltransferase involved in cell wall biosynthesis